MKALVGALNQEKALVGAFSVIVKTGCGTDGALHSTTAPAQLYPVIISISCADQTDRDVSPAVITDRVQNNANFLIPFATLKIHCTFAKTIQILLSAYCISIPKTSLFEKYFHFCL